MNNNENIYTPQFLKCFISFNIILIVVYIILHIYTIYFRKKMINQQNNKLLKNKTIKNSGKISSYSYKNESLISKIDINEMNIPNSVNQSPKYSRLTISIIEN